MIQQVLLQLYKSPDSINPTDVADALELAAGGELSEVEIAALLVALAMTKLDCDSRVLSAAVQRLRKPHITHQNKIFKADIVGTGGDGHSTFNVSTAAAIVAAGAGLRVCKFGGSSSTSASGSADVLSLLRRDTTTPSESLFSFLHASHCYPTLSTISAVRRRLPFPTIFNALGPLLNPENIAACVVGVHSPRLALPVARVLQERHTDALVVCGDGGLDEISPAGPTRVWRVTNNEIDEFVLNPSDFGLQLHPLEEVTCRTPAESAEIIRGLLDNTLDDPARRDFVLLNAAALLVVAHAAPSWSAGVQLARTSIVSGSATAVLCQK